jgi:hypothetical protein
MSLLLTDPKDIAFATREWCERFLTGYEGDSDKASKAMLDTCAWRRSFGADDLPRKVEMLEQNSELGQTYVPPYRSLAGRDTLWLHVGRNEKKTKHDYDSHIIAYSMERALARPNATKMLDTVIDFTNFKLNKAPSKRELKGIIATMMTHYPEVLGQCYIVRPPTSFYVLYKFLKMFIDPVTRAKIVMIKGKDKEVASTLQSFFAPDQYPSCLPGGEGKFDFTDAATRKAYFDEERARVAAKGLEQVR